MLHSSCALHFSLALCTLWLWECSERSKEKWSANKKVLKVQTGFQKHLDKRRNWTKSWLKCSKRKMNKKRRKSCDLTLTFKFLERAGWSGHRLKNRTRTTEWMGFSACSCFSLKKSQAMFSPWMLLSFESGKSRRLRLVLSYLIRGWFKAAKALQLWTYAWASIAFQPMFAGTCPGPGSWSIQPCFCLRFPPNSVWFGASSIRWAQTPSIHCSPQTPTELL